MSYRFADSLRAGSGWNSVPSWSCSQAVSKPVWHTQLQCVQWKTPDDGQRNCPKHVEFYPKNKFEKLVHLVGFNIRIYHDARSCTGWERTCVLCQPVHETATYKCDDTRGCVMQFGPPDDKHMCSKHVEAWNKLIVKQFSASSWLITEINILRCTVSKTSKKYRCCKYKHNIGVHSRNPCCRGKAVSITYSECVTGALVIQRAKRMRCIMLTYAACHLVPYFYLVIS